MKRLASALLLGLSLLSVSAQAQTLSMTSFEDQWEKPVTVTADSKWLIVTQAKESGNIVKETFDALGMKDLGAYKVIYLADISAMPSFVTKLFALPKMRDYDFQMALIREEGDLAKLALPIKDKEAVAVFALDNLVVGQAYSFANKADLETFLKENVIK